MGIDITDDDRDFLNESEENIVAMIKIIDSECHIAVVDQDQNLILTFGIESTLEMAISWAEKAIDAEGWLEGNDDPPDAYSRAH